MILCLIRLEILKVVRIECILGKSVFSKLCSVFLVWTAIDENMQTKQQDLARNSNHGLLDMHDLMFAII